MISRHGRAQLLRVRTLGAYSGSGAWPLNSDVRRISMTGHRAIELLVGFALVSYSAYAISSGRVLGKFRSYSRSENPWSFWVAVLITFGVGAVFLFGGVSWRN